MRKIYRLDPSDRLTRDQLLTFGRSKNGRYLALWLSLRQTYPDMTPTAAEEIYDEWNRQHPSS